MGPADGVDLYASMMQGACIHSQACLCLMCEEGWTSICRQGIVACGLPGSRPVRMLSPPCAPQSFRSGEVPLSSIKAEVLARPQAAAKLFPHIPCDEFWKALVCTLAR